MAIRDPREFIALLEKKGQPRPARGATWTPWPDAAFFAVNGFVAIAILAGAVVDRLIG